MNNFTYDAAIHGAEVKTNKQTFFCLKLDCIIINSVQHSNNDLLMVNNYCFATTHVGALEQPMGRCETQSTWKLTATEP